MKHCRGPSMGGTAHCSHLARHYFLHSRPARAANKIYVVPDIHTRYDYGTSCSLEIKLRNWQTVSGREVSLRLGSGQNLNKAIFAGYDVALQRFCKSVRQPYALNLINFGVGSKLDVNFGSTQPHYYRLLLKP